MINAKIVADSITATGDRLTTLEIVFPRYILAELNTHRLFSKNSASSRAIPFEKMAREVVNNPFIPYAWQKDHKGMQGNEYITDDRLTHGSWLRARNNAIQEASMLNMNIEVTKQLANRLLEPFMYHKVLISATEWENFFNLRCPRYELHTKNPGVIYKSRKDLLKEYPEYERNTELEWLSINRGQADIHMMFLAEAIYDAIQESTPKKLEPEEWHIPYGDNIDPIKIKELFAKTAGSGYDPNNPTPDAYYYDALDALYCKISIARCARLSYQTLGDNPEINYEKDLDLFENLVKSKHLSPTEHIARVMNEDQFEVYTHTMPRFGGVYTEKGWCRNFKGFIQYRELLD